MFIGFPVVAGAIAAWLLLGASGAKTARDGALTPADAYAQKAGAGPARMPKSADHVSATAIASKSSSSAGEWTIAVELHIDRGWHINTNPASLPFLIPTTLQVTSGGSKIPLQTRFPPGRDSGIKLNGTEIRVLDDGATILATPLPQEARVLAAGTLLELALTVQSCSDRGVCLPPSTLNYFVNYNPR